MPDANGQYQLQDYVAELKSRGFDGFSDSDLTEMVNRGYFFVARKHRWYWEESTDPFTLVAGTPYVTLWPTAGGELPYFRAIEKLYNTTTNYRGRLKPMDREIFFSQWLDRDLTLSDARGTPTNYFVWQNLLYVLPVPQVDMTFAAHYFRRLAKLVNSTDVPITPPHLDEVIMDATLMRAHQRAQEIGLAQMKQLDVEEAFDDMRDDEDSLMAEAQDRVRPDDTWL